jgi:hypothetical protein
MGETRIKIKELEMNGETAIRIAECLKKHEPEIWEVLSGELKQALRININDDRDEERKFCPFCKSEVSRMHIFCEKCDAHLMPN